MHTPTLIIGGGLSGLSLAYALERAGHAYTLVEARGRLGGRIKSLRVEAALFDLGPSWVWPGQTRVAALAGELDLQLFEQWSNGAQLFEQASGEVVQDMGFMSMAGSLRIAGGTSVLTDALAARLNPAHILLDCAVSAIDDSPAAQLTDGETITADRIVLCIPPRLAAELRFTPALQDGAMAALRAIPTWMGAHAKFVAVYPTPFWRKDGLSGDASSRRGPLAEIHDASPADGSLGALFGFVGLPADIRAQAGDAVQAASLAQLENLFGAQAGAPIAATLIDWSQDPFTATAADATPPPGHPPYTMPAPLRCIWDDKLIFAVTEMAPDNGGLIEGALAAAEAAARKIIG
ncbi:flavin-dependent amine oxidoreductase [Loktanella sp. PT4BL]|jgi:monoamine oxidase|uniref:flavin monoamine oxidase family protein n=1 Tax=Loktanella sp. PT4BL TaxID=2135611 RepID=UPI000D753BEF|nr:FAD-dependent oxidoreductase [Loktanella sp. PT4BL]PXW68698.1 flavin-dependent amine oxidoreductase [Loktanella sp. PT4BL]